MTRSAHYLRCTFDVGLVALFGGMARIRRIVVARAGRSCRLCGRDARTTLLSGAVSTLLCAATANADDIILRASVRMPDTGDMVRLADVAELHGPAAEALADVRLLHVDDATALHELSIADVRRAIDAHGVNWGHVNLSGRAVVIRPRRASAAGPALAMTGTAIGEGAATTGAHDRDDQPDVRRIPAADIAHEATLRGAITRVVLRGIDVPAGDLTLGFRAEDEPLLATPDTEYRFELQPTSALRSDRVEIAARLWSDGRVARSAKVAVLPLVRTDVAVLLRDVSRREPIAPTDLEIRPEWVAPLQAALLVAPDAVVGQVAAHRLHAGDALRRNDLEQRTLVERGDRVMVRCVVGGLVIAVPAEARADGALGETIEFRRADARRGSFLATVTGPNDAVVRDRHD